MTNLKKIKQILLAEIEKMNLYREDFCRHPGIEFTCDRQISRHLTIIRLYEQQQYMYDNKVNSVEHRTVL